MAMEITVSGDKVESGSTTSNSIVCSVSSCTPVTSSGDISSLTAKLDTSLSLNDDAEQKVPTTVTIEQKNSNETLAEQSSSSSTTSSSNVSNCVESSLSNVSKSSTDQSSTKSVPVVTSTSSTKPANATQGNNGYSPTKVAVSASHYDAIKSVSSVSSSTSNSLKFGLPVPKRVFVGCIPIDVTNYELRHLFSQFGTVNSTKIIMDRAGISRGYGFITFESELSAQKAIKESENLVLKNRRLNVLPAVMKQPYNNNIPQQDDSVYSYAHHYAANLAGVVNNSGYSVAASTAAQLYSPAATYPVSTFCSADGYVYSMPTSATLNGISPNGPSYLSSVCPMGVSSQALAGPPPAGGTVPQAPQNPYIPQNPSATGGTGSSGVPPTYGSYPQNYVFTSVANHNSAIGAAAAGILAHQSQAGHQQAPTSGSSAAAAAAAAAAAVAQLYQSPHTLPVGQASILSPGAGVYQYSTMNNPGVPTSVTSCGASCGTGVNGGPSNYPRYPSHPTNSQMMNMTVQNGPSNGAYYAPYGTNVTNGQGAGAASLPYSLMSENGVMHSTHPGSHLASMLANVPQPIHPHHPSHHPLAAQSTIDQLTGLAVPHVNQSGTTYFGYPATVATMNKPNEEHDVTNNSAQSGIHINGSPYDIFVPQGPPPQPPPSHQQGLQQHPTQFLPQGPGSLQPIPSVHHHSHSAHNGGMGANAGVPLHHPHPQQQQQQQQPHHPHYHQPSQQHHNFYNTNKMSRSQTLPASIVHAHHHSKQTPTGNSNSVNYYNGFSGVNINGHKDKSMGGAAPNSNCRYNNPNPNPNPNSNTSSSNNLGYMYGTPPSQQSSKKSSNIYNTYNGSSMKHSITTPGQSKHSTHSKPNDGECDSQKKHITINGSSSSGHNNSNNKSSLTNGGSGRSSTPNLVTKTVNGVQLFALAKNCDTPEIGMTNGQPSNDSSGVAASTPSTNGHSNGGDEM